MTSQNLGSPPAAGKAPVNILLVDDEVRNLDVLESILTSTDYQLVRVRTAQEALMNLIEGEFAVIVLDIQMPDTTGIELAHLIKQRRRTQDIPIIFLTAYYQEDKDILQGYEVGAVDYLTKPIDSQILKSKIAVFVELFRKTRALAALNSALEIEVAQRQKAELALRQANNELEMRVLERMAAHEELMSQKEAQTRLFDATLSSITDLAYTFDLEGNWILKAMEMATRTASIAIERKRTDEALRESERRYSQLVSSIPAAVYTTDAQGRVTLYNEAAVVLWGRTPEVGRDLWTGAHRMYALDGTVLPMDRCPMAVTLRKGRSVRGEEVIIERPDGTRRNALPHPEPIRDSSGRIVGAVNMVLDITERKRAEEASRRLAAIVESSDDAIVSKDLNGIITSWNRGAERLFGYRAEEVNGQPTTVLMPPDRPNEGMTILERIRGGERMENYETVRRHKDGTIIEISLTVSPIKDANGSIIGVSKIVRNIAGR